MTINNESKWESVNSRQSNKTTITPTQNSERKREDRSKHQIQEDIIYGCQKKGQTNMQIAH